MSGDIVMMNDAVCERLGYTRDELIGTPLVKLHPEDKRQEAARALRAMLHGREEYHPPSFVTKDGREIPIESRITRGRWNGQDMLFGVSKDISALTSSEEKFSKMFHSNAAVMMLSTLHDSRIIDVNEAFLATFGYVRDEVVGKTLDEITFFPNPADREPLRAQALKEGRMNGGEMAVITKQGEIRYGLVSGEVLDVQNKKYLITTGVDITYRKQVEEALRQEREFSNSAIDSLPGIFYLLDIDGNLHRWNKNAETVTGHSSAEIERMHFTHFFSGEQRWAVVEGVRKAFAQGYDALEADVVSKNGAKTPYFFSGRRVTLKGRQYVIGLGMDISNLKNLEQELRTHQDHLEQKIAERTQELETNREELETKTRTLEEVNTALKVLLRQIGEDKKDLEARFVSNVKQLVLPYVEKVKRGRLDHWQQSCLSIIQTNLNEIVSPLTQSLGQLGLTPRETQIAALIKEGKTTKEIAEIIGVAPSAVDTNRNRIRHKLKLNNKKVNLQSYLQSIMGARVAPSTGKAGGATPSTKG
jgi:PAS domain S-box-containing protein